MKSQERHKLKENEFARTVGHARDVLATRQRDITWAVTAVVVLLAIVGGYVWWRQSTASRGTDLLATALAVYEAPVVPAAAPAPGSLPPVQQPGTYLTEQAKLEAALPKFIEAADKYPSTPAGITARYHAASILAGLGRYSEAEQRFQEVVDESRHEPLRAHRPIWGSPRRRWRRRSTTTPSRSTPRCLATRARRCPSTAC